ncbi:RecQ family ATP-dependent DNA helicase [Alistipes indistinctus]|uniref:RecQ family ATP-dependent DNA helicase n=1 Tax=Alistipes indistinctus TaxID=626932 RepID=UPI003F0151C9
MPHPPFTGDYAAILKKYWGHDTFRPLQLETIESVAAGRDTLVLMPTGGGKSVIYQVPALASEGVCIVITPLISLMKDQVDRLRSRRILAEAIHGGRGRQEIDRVLDNCIYGDVKFLYISPERVDSELFRMRFAKMKVSLIAVDEAHCISQWGYDFRPAYLQIARLRDLQPEAAILALTASATPKVAADIMQHLRFREPNLKQMSFARANLSYVVRRTEDKREHLLRIVNNVPGSGIVYVRTREKTETVAKFLQENGIEADSYHGGMGYLTRSLKQENWTGGKTRVIVATNAFGMGIDKADVRFVIHYDICDSLEAYYQEAGRAGRDGRPAYAVMLLSGDDPSRVANRLRLEFPPVDTIRTIYEGLFNYLQVAIGEGKHRAFAFNIHEFAARMKLFPPTVVNALKILQQNGYLILTDETDNPPRIRFIVQRDDLYRMRVTRRELNHILTVLLRQYTGLFSDFVPIDEQELAQLSGYTVNHIHELLRQLWQLHVIRYIPGNRSPMLILSEERLPGADVRISPESYKRRQEVAQERIDAVFRYAENETECRSLVIQNYFGEQTDLPCGRCDICRELRKHTEPQSSAARRDEIRRQIAERLAAGPLDLKTLAGGIRCEIDALLGEVEAMTAEGKIIEEKSGKLRINR